jgi:tape measure domain-containing protein
MAQYTINFSTNANEIIRDIERVSGKVAEVARAGRSVQISLDAAPLRTAIDTTFRQLDKQIALLQRKLAKTQIGSPAFQMRAAQIGTLQGVRERGGMQAASIQLKKQAEAFDIGSAERLQRVLQAARIEASQISPNTSTWVEFQRQIGQIQGQIKATDRAAESIQLQAQLGALSPGSLNALETKLVILRNRAREISPNTTEWKELNKEISKSEQALEKQTRRPLTRGQRFGAAGGAFLYGGGLGGGAGSALGGIAGGLLGGVPGAFTGAAAGQLVDNLAQQAAGVATFVAEINKSKIALAGVTRNIGDYQTALSAAQEAGNLFLIPIKDSIGQFTKLQASVAGAGYETATTQQIFKGIAAAILATGGNTEDLNGALRATAQVFSKGKVTAEELRGQIGERLPGAFTIFAQATGRSTQQLDEDLQKGKVTLNDFIKFTNELFKRYGSTAEILAKAPENAGARLQVILQSAAYEYLGMFQIIGAAFQSYAADLLSFVVENKNAIKTTISEFIVFAQDLYSIFDNLVQALFPVFKNLFSFMFSNFAKGLNSLATLAEETRRAAGGPEQRAQKQVEALYPNPMDRALYGAQAYREALNVELQYEKGAPGRRRTRSQRVADMEKVLFPQFTPSQFGKGLGGKTNLDDTGKEGGGAAGKRKNYVSQLAKIYQEELQNKLLYIDQDASLSDREREIQKAAESFRYENLIAEAEYTEKTGAEKTKNIANLSQYLKETKRLYDLEKSQIQSRYEGVITRPLREMLGEDRKAQIELEASLQSLAAGRDELSNVEKRQVQIKQALLGLDKDQIAQMQPLIDLVLKEAQKVDNLTDAQKRANKAKDERNRLDEQIKSNIQNLQNEIAILRAITEEERKRLKIRQENRGISKEKENEIYQLEKVRDNIKATREIIDNFVTDTSSDYKGFLKAVISGEDAADALQQFQEGLQDRVLTIFLDFTMKPIEDFFKDTVGGSIIGGLFPSTEQEETATRANEPVVTELQKANEKLQQIANNTSGGGPASSAISANGMNIYDTNILSPGLQATMQGMDTGVGFGAGLSGFSEQIGSISTGLQNATPSLTGFSEAVNGFSATSVDAAVKTAQAAGDASKNGSTLLQSLGGVVQGVGMLAGAAMGIVAGIKQIEKGDTSSVLGGIGSILMGVGGGILGFGKLFGANGGIASGGWKPFPVRAFANGGMVQGPTLGLVGEGKYNEAIVPLPDGRSIPVQMQGDSIRDKMGGSSNGGAMASPVLSMNFETTTINNVEYVSRDQLEQAMMETRKLAVRDGARQGANLAIDKLQQSPSTRRRIGI